MGSVYLNGKAKSSSFQRATGKLVALFLAFGVLCSIFAGAAFSKPATEGTTASAADPIKWIVCKFDETSAPRIIYNFTQTDEWKFHLFSKSAVATGRDDVNSGLNSILDWVKTEGGKKKELGFEATNNRIIGQNFEGTLSVKYEDKPWERWNQGAKINPYDRFGVAGLNFTNYMGEWKIIFVNICDDSETKSDYDTGSTTNFVKVASWNVCSKREYCNMPKLDGSPGWSCTSPADYTPGNMCGVWTNSNGKTITRDDVWGPAGSEGWKARAELAWRTDADRRGEMVEINPDVLLLEEVGFKPESTDVLCKNMDTVETKTAQQICFNPKKFRAVSNTEYPKSQYSENFSSKCTPGRGNGFAWSVLEDKNYRRSVWVAVHTQAHAGNEGIRRKQVRCVTAALKANFANSFYPIIIGGDMNSNDPKESSWDPTAANKCEKIKGNRLETARVYCNNGYTPTSAIAQISQDAFKRTFQGASPWSSANWSGFPQRIDSIWVNGYIGVGSYRVYAPAGKSTSDHAMISATLNLNGTVVGQAGDPTDPGTNKYYTNRLEPQATWDDISTSADPRTKQFSKGFAMRFNLARVNAIVNSIFFITKMIVVLAIALIGLAFSDVSSMFGITDIVVGKNGSGGLYTGLQNNLFLPMVVLAFFATAVHLFWIGIVKRQYRTGLGNLLKSLACFFAAMIVAVAPAWFISLPNNVAIIGQSVVASALNTGLTGGNGLCSSNLSSDATILGSYNGKGETDTKAAYTLLEKASINVQSNVGCSLWYNLLVRSWVEGQWGANYDELYGTTNGVCNTKTDHTCLGNETSLGYNRNSSWVGDPNVPLGGGLTGGKLESNWALFQISTQTNAHAPLVAPEQRGSTAKYNQGVANDWWRIVDATSNYNEVLQRLNVCDSFEGPCPLTGGRQNTTPQSIVEPTQTLEEWNTWVGNNPLQRLSSVISSVFVAVLGVSAPLIFALLSAVYGIGVAILMALAPVFFLFGCWSGRGWNLFKAWADMVLNLTMKRIALGLLTIVSISFVATILNQMDKIGYWQSMLLLIIISFVLVKSRHKILNAVAFARFSTTDLQGTASKVAAKVKTGAGAVGGLATGVAAGGVFGAREGIGFAQGAKAGFGKQLNNLAYRSPTLRAYTDTKALLDGSMTDYLDQPCAFCGEPLTSTQPVGRLANGGIIHSYHMWEKDVNGEFTDLGTLGHLDGDDHTTVFDDGLALRSAQNLNLVDMADDEALDEALAERLGLVANLANSINNEIALHRSRRGNQDIRARGETPAIPAQIRRYVDVKAVELAWKEEQYEYLQLAYTHGWIQYAQEKTGGPDITKEDARDVLFNVQQGTRAE